MQSVARVIAVGTGKGDYIASGVAGKVYHHGDNRVYKEAYIDGTYVWLERCFAIQKRIGIDHPLCEFMPEIFSLRQKVKQICHPGGKPWYTRGMYEVCMRKYIRPVGADHGNAYTEQKARGIPDPYHMNDYAFKRKVDMAVRDVIGWPSDMHSGNVLWCEYSKRWVVTDPSAETASHIAKNVVHPKFARAKRVSTQYGPQRRH